MADYYLTFYRAPGDTLLLTSLVRDLAAAGHRVNVDTRFSDLWRHNPWLSPDITPDKPGVTPVHFGGPSLTSEDADTAAADYSHSGARPYRHYLVSFHEFFERKTGIRVPVTAPHADLHLSPDERDRPRIRGDYWVVVPGGKLDATVKWWPLQHWQTLVDRLGEAGIYCVQEGASRKPFHHHPPLYGVASLVGKTTIRELLVNLHHARGVICGVSLPMHAAAALQKPCVVVAGGREEPWHEAYVPDYEAFRDAAPLKVPHRYLHTLSQLSCCSSVGCWKDRVEPREEMPNHNRRICEDPRLVSEPAGPGDSAASDALYAGCQTMITPARVVEEVLSLHTPGPPNDPTCLKPLPRRAYETRSYIPSPPPLPLEATEQVADWPLARAGLVQQTRIRVDPGKAAGPERDITLALLLHGDNAEQHHRFLRSLSRNTDLSRVELRVLLCGVGPFTVTRAEQLDPFKVYWIGRPRGKYAALRQLFHDTQHRLTTRWLVFADDATRFLRRDWLDELKQVISGVVVENPKVAMVGRKYSRRLRTPAERAWFEEAPWNTGQVLYDVNGRLCASGDRVHYTGPNFFAIQTRAIRHTGAPDHRVDHSGGGLVLCEQLRQAGWPSRSWAAQGQYVSVDEAVKDSRPKHVYPWHVELTNRPRPAVSVQPISTSS